MIIYFYGVKTNHIAVWHWVIFLVYNHDYHANAEYEMDFERVTIRIKTVRQIQKGEEIFINYNGSWNDTKPFGSILEAEDLNNHYFFDRLNTGV